MAYTRPDAASADATFAGAAAYTRADAATADATFQFGPQALIEVATPLGAPALFGAAATAWVSADTPLGAPAVLASNSLTALIDAPSMLGAAQLVGAHVAGWASAASPLGTPTAYGALAAAWAAADSMLGAPALLGSVPLSVWAAAASPLGAPQVYGYHDFTAGLGDAITTYVMDLITETGTVRVPISSWQATLQTGASNYVQCVVPAVADWTDAINAATAFTITRTAEPAGLPVIEYEMASAPLETISIARGPTNYTATLSGYSPAFAVDEAPPSATDRTLSAVRSVTTTSGKMRARCAIDWTLRPAQRAYLPDGSSFIVGYINYYQPQGFDSYMDVGE